MLFNSISFLIFFPFVTLIYFLSPHKTRWLILLSSSCYFYASFIPYYILILFVTIIIDYIAGIYIENSFGRKKKYYLYLSLFANVGILAIFKYYNFFIENINSLFSYFNLAYPQVPYLSIILPVGLSFHTFQAMSYTIEVYRGNQKAERHFGIYSLYVMFYPQLVAGPIERPQNLLHQFREHHKYSSQNLLDGLRLMLWGFFKKLVVADRISIYVNTVYDNPDNYHYLNLIIASVLFSIQIYCDFSGYSDIAIGAARTMGFNLMTNFNRPYFSRNIQEFWRKWHISLSTWFKDYVYIPLGGNKKGLYFMTINIAIIFILSGFWHGANWTYMYWGALHALFMIIYLRCRSMLNIFDLNKSLYNLFSILFVNVLVIFAWIFFRATSLSSALLISKRIFTGFDKIDFQIFLRDINGAIAFPQSSLLFAFFSILVLFIVELMNTPKMDSLKKYPILDLLFFSIILSLIIIIGVFNGNSFIYFQF